jgi:hypothetical protein
MKLSKQKTLAAAQADFLVDRAGGTRHPVDMLRAKTIKESLSMGDTCSLFLVRRIITSYHPFHYKDLVIRLRGAGFPEVQSDFDDAKDTYTVIARMDNKSVQGTRVQRPRP